MFKRKKKKSMYTKVYHSIIYYSPKLEMAQMYSNEEMTKKIMIYSHIRISYYNLKWQLHEESMELTTKCIKQCF